MLIWHRQSWSPEKEPYWFFLYSDALDLLRQRCEIQGALNIPHQLNGIIYDMSDFKIRGSDVTVKIFKLKVPPCSEAPLWSDGTEKPFFDALTYTACDVCWGAKRKGDEKEESWGNKEREESENSPERPQRHLSLFYMHKRKRWKGIVIARVKAQMWTCNQFPRDQRWTGTLRPQV